MKKDLVRKRLLKYTRKAFRMLSQMDKPRILDIGCGSGAPTLELSRLSQGREPFRLRSFISGRTQSRKLVWLSLPPLL